MARLLRAQASEIVFTSCGTESDNLALFGIVEPGQHLITTAIEHHAVLHAAEALEKRGVAVTYLPCDAEGVVSPEALQSAMRPNTRLVSIMFANNETGTVQPIAELAAIAKEAGALFHSDAVQAAGKLALDLSAEGPLAAIDLLSLSGHKMYAPQGTGVLFVRKGVRVAPLFHGGSHERQRRAGTENVAGIVALGKAAAVAEQWLAGATAVDAEGCRSPCALGELRDRLEQTVMSEVSGCGVNGGAAARTPNTTNFYFDDVSAESLVITLDLNGLSVSGGSACQSGASEPSHVLSAMGLSPDRARSSIRISLSRMTTPDEVDRAAKLISAAVLQTRQFSASRNRSEAQTA